MTNMLDGYIIERQGVAWEERFYKSFCYKRFFRGEPIFGDDKRAKVFITKDSADTVKDKIENEAGIYVIVHACSDFFPPSF